MHCSFRLFQKPKLSIEFKFRVRSIAVLVLVYILFYLSSGRMQGDLKFNILREACPFNGDGLELLGLKWLPSINTSQAKEMTPYEVSIVIIIANDNYSLLD